MREIINNFMKDKYKNFAIIIGCILVGILMYKVATFEETTDMKYFRERGLR
jgi:hypothetical protein